MFINPHPVSKSDLNFKILRQDTTIKKFTDCTITFVDDYRSINLSCHKIILFSSSDYFRNAFSCGDMQHMTIKTRDARIMYDVILSFYDFNTDNTLVTSNLVTSNKTRYGYPEWEYLLETFNCRNYLLLDNDISQLYNLKVPIQGFELLVQVIGVNDLTKNEKLVSVIRDNLPSNPIPSNPILSNPNPIPIPEYLDKLLAKQPIIMVADDLNVSTWSVSGKLISSFSHNSLNVSISYDGKLIATVDGSPVVRLLNDNGDLIKEIQTTERQYSDTQLMISHNNKFILLFTNGGDYQLWNIKNGKLIRTISSSDRLKGGECAAISRNDKIFAYKSGNDIFLQNLKDGEVFRHFKSDNKIDCMTFSNDNEYFVSGGQDINVWHVNSGMLTCSMSSAIQTFPIFKLAISRDDRFIIINQSFYLQVWSIIENKSIFTSRRAQMIAIHNNLIALQYYNTGDIQIFDVISGQLVTTLLSHGNSLCIQFV